MTSPTWVSPLPSALGTKRNTILLGLLYIGLAMAIAFAVRWPHLSESLWLDELHTSWSISGSWAEVYERIKIGNQSPFYFGLVKVAAELFGLNETALRLPSLIAGLLLVGVVGILVWYWSQSIMAGLFCAVLVALDPVCIFYANEARPYACLQLVALCHLGIVAEIPRRGTGWFRLAFIAGALLLTYLQYTAVLFVYAEAVFLLGVIEWRKPGAVYSGRKLLADLALIAVGSLPAILHAQSIVGHGNAWKAFIPEPSFAELVRQMRLNAYLLWPIVGAIAVFMFTRTNPKASTQRKAALCPVTLVFLLPMAIAWLIAELNIAPLLFRRYLLPTYVAGIVLAALIWATIANSWFRAVVAALTIGTFLFNSASGPILPLNGIVRPDRWQDWRSAVKYVNDNAQANDVALVRSGFIEGDQLAKPHASLLEAYNLAPVNNIYQLKIPAQPMPTSREYWSPFLETEFAASRAGNRWFVFNGSAQRRGEFFAMVHKIVGSRLEVRRDFGDVMVIKMHAWPAGGGAPPAQ
jgi:mannosyltransferase